MHAVELNWATVGTVILALSGGFLAWGCGESPPARNSSPADDTGNAALGASVYANPLADGNSFACATCHALAEPSGDGLRRPGHPIGDSTRRSRWKNGKASTLLQAVNSCVTEWMVAPAWSSIEPRFLDLRAFLETQAKADHAPDVHFEIVPPPSDTSGGDAARGRSTFEKTCVVCHGAGGFGTDRGPRIAGSIRAADYIAARIRTSGSPSSAVYPNLSGGVMPFWAKDRLDDGEVRDLVAFVREPIPDGGVGPVDAASNDGSGPVVDALDTAMPDGRQGDSANPDKMDAGSVLDATADARDAAPPSGCTRRNARVGWKADLGINTGEGQVSGFVTMVDDCTLELTSFSYDGNGIEVRVYGSKSSTFRPGFTIGPDLVGRVFNKAVLRVTLPAGKTLDDLDWVSIWCVKAGANFGSGPFLQP